MTFTNYDTYFSFGCKANHKEVEKLTIININNELVQQSIDTMDEAFVTKPMIEGVEVDGTWKTSQVQLAKLQKKSKVWVLTSSNLLHLGILCV